MQGSVPGEALAKLKEANVTFIRVCWCSLNGMWKTKAVAMRQLESLSSNGVGLTVADPGLPFTQDILAPNAPVSVVGEARLLPDWSSLRIIPWSSHARVLAIAFRDPSPEHPIPWEMDARTCLLKLVDNLKAEFNLTLKVGFEEEFHILKGNDEAGWRPVDASNYGSVDSFNRNEKVLQDAVSHLEAQAISVDMIHAESGAGQMEIVCKYDDCVRACDNHLIAKESISVAARQNGLKATFVPKLSPSSAGSGAHVNVSVWKDGENLTANLENSVAGSFFGGVFSRLPVLTAIGCPTSNSFLRLVPGAWAGAFQCWGVQHKECPMRYCHWKGSERMELKCCDGTSNPYLFLSAVILSGADGIRNSQKLPEPVTSPNLAKVENIAKLPEDLPSALALLEQDELLMGMSGDMMRCFVAVKKAELDLKPKDLLQVMLERF